MRKSKVSEYKATATLFEQDDGLYVVECKMSPTVMSITNSPVEDRTMSEMLLEFIGMMRRR